MEQFPAAQPGLEEDMPGTHLDDRPSLVVIDDNEGLLFLVRQILEGQGFVVYAAASAEKALEIFDRVTPDVIVCDVMMPGINGYQLQKRVLGDARLASVPFIFLTALSDPQHVRMCKELGCDEYLAKPFLPDDLIAVVKGKVDVSRKRRERLQFELNNYRRRIIHTLSHEFRTPLVSINTGAELLMEKQGDLDKDGERKLIESIYRGGLRLQRLVDDFMLLQQIDSGHAEDLAHSLARDSSLALIAETAVSSFLAAALEEGLHPTVDVHIESDVNVHVYEIHVINAIHRLLSNAAKFAGPDLRIELRVTHEGAHGAVHVRDFGPGLETSEREHAKEAFVQVNREKLEQQGCGLGLTIAQYFTVLNGGALELKNPVHGSGLEAIISLPEVHEPTSL